MDIKAGRVPGDKQAGSHRHISRAGNTGEKIMTTTPTGENPTTLSDREYEDLTVIPGIKAKRQQKLRDLFGIRTWHDLAAISGKKDKIKSMAKGLGVSQSLIERAATCAQELVADANTPSQQIVESTESESKGRANPSTSEGEWEWIAAFIVEFKVLRVKGQEKGRQITVGPLEIDKGGTWLEGPEDRKPTIIEGQRLYSWMQEQLGERMPQVPELAEKPKIETRPAAAPSAGVPEVKIEITQIRAFQPPQTKTPTGIGKANELFRGFISDGEPFALEVSFELVGIAAADLAKERVVYRARCYAYDRSTGTPIHLGDTLPDTLVESKPSYTAVLPRVTLPSGNYRLQVLVELQDPPLVSGYFEVPLFQVV